MAQREKPMQLDDEAQLVGRARGGEIGALDALMNAHRDRILNLAWQILRDHEAAEDAAQEAFVRAFSGLNSFRGASSFGTWMYRVALNVCLEKRRALKPESEPENEESAAPSSDHDLKMTLDWVLDQLPEPLRLSLILREWHGLSYEEMAVVCTVPLGTVRSRLHEARARFREIWLELERETS
ncbi:sigma-70 family RNA polymerase sigma factor [bacterium]|nr:MAG: sigma-70 family RNA polymerase sigma factor [bacterium]